MRNVHFPSVTSGSKSAVMVAPKIAMSAMTTNAKACPSVGHGPNHQNAPMTYAAIMHVHCTMDGIAVVAP